jgi:DNA ligase D-like protein (predicted 3'-phosphoesterase)
VAGKDSLRRYRDKRDFAATGEPRGADAPGITEGGEGGAAGLPSYVVQIHDASTMHFDFRLEVDGVLKSWAVPKGPSTDPRDKRLAVPTEDHPLEYREYEGVIGSGEYGAGTVIVWDTGTYRPTGRNGTAGDTARFGRALAAGHADFWLEGTKLQGGYALTRFRGGHGHESDGEEAWLLVKRTDAKADRSGSATPSPRRARSVRSGRTLRQVERDEAPGGPSVARSSGTGRTADGSGQRARKTARGGGT